MARLRLDARKVQTAQTALKERREKTQSMKSARWPRKLREWGGGGHTRRAINSPSFVSQVMLTTNFGARPTVIS